MIASESLSVVIATAFRTSQLANCLASLAAQSRVPDQIIVVDGAPAPGVEDFVQAQAARHRLCVDYLRWNPPSAALQRNAGAENASGSLILFLDDDAYPEPDCFEKILRTFDSDNTKSIGAVGVLIRNQLCAPPRPRAKRWFDFLAGEESPSYAGRVIGPAVNIGPEPTPDGRLVTVEWLNSGCTAYRREAFMGEQFCKTFFGYSFMEDVDLSVRVGRHWSLVVNTDAYMHHDTQPSRFKAPFTRSRMAVCNRYHVMTESLGRRSWNVHFRFFAYVLMNWMLAMVRTRSIADLRLRSLELLGLGAGFLAISPRVIRNVALATASRARAAVKT